ncbi:MAG: tetratricopeptide repeat protein [Prevotella sp.]
MTTENTNNPEKNSKSAGNAEQQLDVSESLIRKPLTSDDFYKLGNKFRREGKWHEAINNYIAAIERDPDSPAVEAKQMLEDILGYYNKDMYNP